MTEALSATTEDEVTSASDDDQPARSTSLLPLAKESTSGGVEGAGDGILKVDDVGPGRDGSLQQPLEVEKVDVASGASEAAIGIDLKERAASAGSLEGPLQSERRTRGSEHHDAL